VYVDDMLIFSKLTSAIISFKEQLTTIFPTTNLGEAPGYSIWRLSMTKQLIPSLSHSNVM
jgi:hypothetical protein